MLDEQGNEVPDPTPEQAPLAEAPAPVDESTLPFPADGQSALWYNGTETITREGLTFTPDSLQVVPDDVAAKLIGRDNIRVVAESEGTWPHFLATRARRRALSG